MQSAYVALVVVGVALLLGESLIRVRSGLGFDLAESRVSIGVGVIAYSMGLVSQLTLTAVAFWAMSHLALWHLPLRNPLTWVAYVLIDDFTGYWSHRASHRFRILWSAHLVHHSAHDITMANAARLSPVEAVYQPLVDLWAPFLGFPVAIYAPLTVLSLLLAQVQHTRVIGSLGWLDRWLNTPSNHRVHHGRNRRYLDCNFGGWTMIWDRLFGTYRPETEPVEFGVTDPIDTRRIVPAALGGYPALLRDARGQPDLRSALRCAIAPPGATTSSIGPSSVDASSSRMTS